MEYLPRSLYTELDELLPHLPAIAIDEPKGVGKTATAARRADLTLGLDSPSTRAILESDFALSSYQNKKLLLDEWQHLPQIWDMVRRKVDADSPPGTFILTGSATPYDMRSSHSGVGRVVSLRMRPMGLHERGITAPQIRLSDLLAGEADISAQPSDFSLADYMDAIVNSGFPGFSALPPPRALHQQLDGYLVRVIDRDIPELGAEVRHPIPFEAGLQPTPLPNQPPHPTQSY